MCQSAAVSYVRMKLFSPSWKHTSQVMELQYHETRSERKNRQDMRSECAVVNISEHSQVPSFPEPVASFGHALAPTMYFALVTTPWLHEWKEVASPGEGTAIYWFHRDVPLRFSLLLWKNNTRCSESALQLRLDFSFMVFKQFTLGSESLGLD